VCLLQSNWATGGYIDTTGRIWREPLEILFTSYDELTADPSNGCNPANGICVGMLRNHDLTGWHWASLADVTKLFGSLPVLGAIPGWDALATGPQTVQEQGADWALHDLDGTIFVGICAVHCSIG